MTIESRLAEIQARVENATHGPWSVYRGDRIGTYITRPDLAGVAREWSLTWSDADAEFIAHARTDVPWLLGQVELRDKALEAVLDLHAADEDGDCAECIRRAQGRGDQSYPCPTVTRIQEALNGIA